MKRFVRLTPALFIAAGYCWLVAVDGTAQSPTPTASPQAQKVRLNTVGFLPHAPKRASVSLPCNVFSIVRTSDGAKVFDGVVSDSLRNKDTDEQLFTADFSAFTQPGEYRMEVNDVGASDPFRIADDIYTKPFHTVTRAMYLWRCGTAVRGEYNGRAFEHAACHLDDAHLDLVTSGGTPKAERHRAATGGWHDAGDYNKYVVNAGVTVGCMLRAWSDFQPQIARIELNLPESNGPLPDFLAEVKWELDWLLSMQADDGSVYHKVSTQNYLGHVLPEHETERRYFGQVGTQATANFVAMMAMAARSFRPFEPAYADRCLAATEKGYAYLSSHPAYQRPGQTGFSTAGYDSNDRSARVWAAAEIWESTGNPEALAYFEACMKSKGGEFEAVWDWGNVKNLGLITYLESQRPGRDSELVMLIRNNLLETAARIVGTRNGHGYERPLGERYFWGCNGSVARQVVLLEAAHRVDAKQEYRDTALDALNHLFGRNVHGRSYVTGLGHNPPKFPHDRRAAADEVDEPWPGYLVGGANPNAVDWRDVEADYRTNEIAINWNGALIYALAAFLDAPAAGEMRSQ